MSKAGDILGRFNEADLDDEDMAHLHDRVKQQQDKAKQDRVSAGLAALRAARERELKRERRKQPSKMEVMEKEATERGLIVRTHSPGDGVTRYRFFVASEAPPNQSYFGPKDGVNTELGYKRAMQWLWGVNFNK